MRSTGRRVGVVVATGLLVAGLAGRVAGQVDPALVQAFSRFLHTQDLQFDLVPDLYEGGYARISLRARDANLGGILVDEAWFKLVGISLDVAALQKGELKVLDYRGAALHGRVSVQRLQEFFLASNAFKDLRLWSDGTSVFGEGTVPYHSVPIKIWLKGQFALKDTRQIVFHVENMRINGFPLFTPIIRMLEAQINPVMSQKDWPVTFQIKSLRMTTEGFVVSSQVDALAPYSICAWLDGTVSKP